MQEIRYGFEQGLSLQQVATYAYPNIGAYTMIERRTKIETQNKNLQNELRNKYRNLSSSQIKKLTSASLNGFSEKQIDMLAKKNFTDDEMEFIIKNLQRKEEAYDKGKTYSHISTGKEVR